MVEIVVGDVRGELEKGRSGEGEEEEARIESPRVVAGDRRADEDGRDRRGEKRGPDLPEPRERGGHRLPPDQLLLRPSEYIGGARRSKPLPVKKDGAGRNRPRLP